jgi:hypothetical protein
MIAGEELAWAKRGSGDRLLVCSTSVAGRRRLPRASASGARIFRACQSSAYRDALTQPHSRIVAAAQPQSKVATTLCRSARPLRHFASPKAAKPLARFGEVDLDALSERGDV